MPDQEVAATAPIDMEPRLQSMLTAAFAALASGTRGQARGLAQAALGIAKAQKDARSEAKALSCLASCDRLASRLRRASEASRRAVQLFQSLGDVAGEAQELTLLAHVCAKLGRSDEAIESALLSVRLTDSDTAAPSTMVMARNGLGVAYSWSGSFDEAQASFEVAALLAASCAPQISAIQPRLNQALTEAMRLAQERYQTGQLPSLKRLQQRVAAYRGLEERGETQMLVQGDEGNGRVMSHVVAGLLCCWLGDLTGAQTEVQVARHWVAHHDAGHWQAACIKWVEAELAWQKSDWAAANLCLAKMTELAAGGEHEQLACLGHLLASQVYERQGAHDLAQAEARNLRRREQRIRAEGQRSRARVVSWQLAARALEATSKQFEQWSFEDALTGIANRRLFEQRLSEQLVAARDEGQPLCVALIDVDHFKVINDTFGHVVGDQVLKALADILVAEVRENDLPARLAGDEFVVMFARTDAAAASRVCERLQAAVLSFDWESLATGLHVGISVGVGAAADDSSVEDLLRRSDRAMYADKQNAAEPPAEANSVGPGSAGDP